MFFKNLGFCKKIGLQFCRPDFFNVECRMLKPPPYSPKGGRERLPLPLERAGERLLLHDHLLPILDEHTLLGLVHTLTLQVIHGSIVNCEF